MRSYVRTYIVILRKGVFLVKQNCTCNRFISMATINKMSDSVFTILILMQLLQKIAVVKNHYQQSFGMRSAPAKHHW